MNILDKIKFTFGLVIYFLKTLPIRLYRVLKAPFVLLINLFKSNSNLSQLLEDLLCFIVLFVDLLAGPEVIMILFIWPKRSLRLLDSKELDILSQTLGNSISEKLLVINQDANVLTSNGKFAFVSFFLIHTNKPMHDKTFAHELIHIWQYTRFGSAYIVKALFAQKSKDGYDYHGAKHLMNSYSYNKGIMEYNFEQQGEILADYYWLQVQKEQFSNLIYEHNNRIYAYFIEDIKAMKIYRF